MSVSYYSETLIFSNKQKDNWDQLKIIKPVFSRICNFSTDMLHGNFTLSKNQLFLKFQVYDIERQTISVTYHHQKSIVSSPETLQSHTLSLRIFNSFSPNFDYVWVREEKPSLPSL